MSAHTPIPWAFVKHRDNECDADEFYDKTIAGSIMGDGESMHIARIWADGLAPSEDAAFIVIAVNNHEKLLARVSRLEAALEMCAEIVSAPTQGCCAFIFDARDGVKTVIEALKEQP
jgi:hypothetical protein